VSTEPVRETSFGGVVVRDGAEVLVIVPRGKDVIALPKGGASSGEPGERAAEREVFEETGVTAVAREMLGEVRYWYRRIGGVRVHKTVRFFLCEYAGGGTAPRHRHEVEHARWMPLDEARFALTFPGERALIDQALSKLANDR
jgi:8-oxo-dGTP pyrophosphatase MutT (NUDIX family)